MGASHPRSNARACVSKDGWKGDKVFRKETPEKCGFITENGVCQLSPFPTQPPVLGGLIPPPPGSVSLTGHVRISYKILIHE